MSLFPTPLINGNRFSFSSIDFRVGVSRIVDVKDIAYKSTLEPGEVYGTGSIKQGRTRGMQKCEGSVTIYREAWGLLLPQLAALTVATSALNPLAPTQAGFQEVAFDIIVSYAEVPASQVQKDVLKGCRIKTVDVSQSESNDPLVVKLELDIMQIFFANTPPLNLVVI